MKVNMRRDSTGHELKPTSTTDDHDAQAPPPSYPSVVYKLRDYSSVEYDTRQPPPSYLDVNHPAVVYINNYPGPPLTDGIVQVITPNHITAAHETAFRNLLSKRMRIDLAMTGAITILFGLLTIGLQVGLLVSHSIVYYYYGFWAGGLLICIGISTIMFSNRYRTYNLERYFCCFKWQVTFLAVILGFGIIIMLTDSCGDRTSNNADSCTSSYNILNAFLLSIIALTFAQTIINTIVIGILKKRSAMNSHTSVA